MPFRVTCPGCKTACVIPDEAIGQNVRCKQCSRVFQVTGARPQSPAAPSAAPPPAAPPTEAPWWQAGQADKSAKPAPQPGTPPPPTPKKPKPPQKVEPDFLEPLEEVAERLEEVADLEPLEEAPADGLQTKPSPRPAMKKKLPPAKKIVRSRRRDEEEDYPRRSSGKFWAIGIVAALLLAGGGVGLALLLSDTDEDTPTTQTADAADVNKDKKPGDKKPGGDKIVKPADKKLVEEVLIGNKPGDRVIGVKPGDRKPDDIKPGDKKPEERIPGGCEPVLPAQPVDLKPPVLAQDKLIRELPDKASEAVVGGGGRYIVLHLPQQHRLAVFDVSEAKVKGFVPADGDNVKFAAGMDKLLVVLPATNIIQRWNLHTLQREVAAPLQFTGTVHQLAMGSASQGPLLVGGGDRFRGATAFLDIKTLKPLNLRTDARGLVGTGDEMRVRVSANGRVFGMWRTASSPQGLQTLVITGNEVRGYYDHTSVGHIVPGPDGKIVYTARGMYTNQAKAIGVSVPFGGTYCLPAVEGNFYLSVATDGGRRGRGGPRPGTVSIHMAGETRPLVTLNDIELPKGINQWAREAFGMDRRILLIPSAKLLITIPETNDKLVLHRFDLDAALDKAGIDYLFVTSRPPASAARGALLKYQLAVRSKQGGLKYKLDSGPKGMTVSPTGLLTWQVPGDFAGGEADVTLSVGDRTGQEVLHSFKLAVSGEIVAQAPRDPPKPADPPAKEPVGKPADPVPPMGDGEIKAPALKGDRQEVKLPSAVNDLAVGGGGRYLILHLAQQRKLAVFDANEGKIVKYLPAAADNVKFAAGQDKLFVALPDNNILQRWSLSRLERELTTQIPGAGRVHHLALGSASHGPLLLARGEQFRVTTSFLDIKTLKPLNVRTDRGDVPGVSADTYLRVSANGRVFGMWNPNVSPQGVTVWVLTGEKLTVHGNGDSSGHVAPGPDGKVVYTGRGLYTNQGKRIGKLDTPGGVYFLPSVQGSFALSVTSPNVNLHFAGETRSLLTLKDVEAPKGVNQWGREPFGTDRRLLLIPAAKLLVTIPDTNDKLVLHHLDLDEALQKSGVDFLFVSSQPPAEAHKGALLSYQLVVKSKQGGLKYKVDSGPKGMTVSPAGLVTWKVPADFAEAETDVILSIADKGGQEAFHTFKLSIGAAGPADPPVKEPPAKEPPPKPKDPPAKEPEPKPKDPPAKEPEPKPMDPPAEGASGTGPYGIKPPALEMGVVERKLPSAATSVVAGGGGRYLILHMPQERKLAIFDANEGKVTRYVPAADDNVLFAAGLDKLVVVLPGTHIIQRWSLSTGKRELTAKFPIKGTVRRLLMGSASHGPLLVGGESTDGRSTGALFLDIRTLKPLRYQLVGDRDFGFDANTSVRVSADGRVFGKWQPNLSPQGITTMVLTGATARVHSNGGLSVGHVVPGPHGKTIYTGRGTFTNQVKAIGKSGTRDGVYSLPAAHGDDYFMTLKIIGTFGGKTKSTLSVHLRGDERPFATLDDVELPDNLNAWDRDTITSDMRIHLIPAARLLVTLAPTNDKLVLHRFDPEAELQKSGRDYLLVTSTPPASVRRLATFNYQIKAKSPKGGFKFKIESGPKGMTVSPEGQVTWKVPFNQTLGNTEVIITVSDSAGQERFHSFTLSVRR